MKPQRSHTTWWNPDHTIGIHKTFVRSCIDRIKNGGCTNHTRFGYTMPAIIEELERERVPYKITSIPGEGYLIEKYNNEN